MLGLDAAVSAYCVTRSVDSWQPELNSLLAVVIVETRHGLCRLPLWLAITVAATTCGLRCSLVVVVVGRWGKLGSRLVAVPLSLQSMDGRAKLAAMVEARFGRVNEPNASGDGGIGWVDRKQHREGRRWRPDEMVLYDRGGTVGSKSKKRASRLRLTWRFCRR